MRVKLSFVVILMMAVLLVSSLRIVAAAENETKEIINIVMDESGPRYIDKILFDAFAKLGYKITVTCSDIKSAIVRTDSGQFDALGVHIEELETRNSNLVRIPESIGFVEYRIFVKEGSILNVDDWDDLAGLRVAIEFQHSYVENKINAGLGTVVNGNRVSDLYEILAAGMCDVVVVPKITQQQMVVPEGIMQIAAIDKQPVYPFVHKSLKHLVPEIANVLRTMNNSGDIEKYQNQEKNVSNGQNGRKNFLYISSDSEDATWDEELSTELKAVLGENDKNEIYTVSLNTNKYPGDYSNSKIVMNMIRAHYMSEDPDAIIVSDNAALEFIKEYYYSVFEGTPVVFCGINNYSPDMIKGFEKYFTGVAEVLSASETTEQLLKMFPKTNNIFVINDYSSDGRAWQQDIESQLQKFNDINITYNPDVEMPELLDIIRKLPPDSLVLTGTYFLDSKNFYFSEKLSEKAFSESSKAPVYSLARSRVGYGEIGGKCVNASYQGRVAAEVALKLAAGTDISELPVVSDTEVYNKWVFDYSALKKYNLTKFSFPANTVFMNKPLSFRESNPTGFYLIIFASAVIFILICVLLSYQRMLANKNKSLVLSQTSLHTTEELLDKEILLRESKELLEKVVQSSPLAYILSVNGKVINSNIYAQELLDIYPGEDIRNIYYSVAEREKLLRKLEVRDFISAEIVRFKTKDYGVNRFHVNISTVDYGGENAYIIWGVNIESVEHQKDSLEKAGKDMQKVFQAIPIPFLILDPISLQLKYANSSYLSLFKQDETEDFEKIDITMFFPETQPNGERSDEFVASLMLETVNSNKPTVKEVQHLLKSGEMIDIKTVCETLSYKGTNAVIVLMQDISAEKRQAEMLKNTAVKEKEANQLKSRFIINMSHEIRTPMNAIIGLSEIEMTKAHTKETYDTFRKINSSAKNLLTIVNDILDFSKIEAEKIDIVEDVFDLEEVISDAMVVASQRLDDKLVEMLVDIDCNLPATLIGDKIRLWQVLKNLLDNSAKYTLKGNITLTARPLNKNPIDNIFVKFQITDTGLGIAKDNIEKLFTPFEQFHQNEITVKGTGLGMVITKQLSELMGGKISVESEYGVGTTISVIIPFKLSKPVLSIKHKCIRDELSQKRVLIVDDNPLIIDTLTHFLIDVGLLPVSARNSDEAYEKIIAYEKNDMPFDIILLDYLLENETCLDLAKKIKKQFVGKTKLILLSAYSKRLTPFEIREHGFVEVIEKPFVPTSFMRIICHALNINEKEIVNNKRINFTNTKVLLCEDNKINQEVAQGMLGMCGITPVVAENGQEALDLLHHNDFHLILMDILMPVMDGHQATIHIRNSNTRYANIPIVAMTANAMKDEVDKCKAEGMNGHISKPIDIEKLYAQLLKWIPRECRTEEAVDISQNKISEQTIEGIDMAQGIARFGGNREKYVRALYKYASTFGGLEQPFNEITQEDNIDTLKKQIHTMKGVSGNLGIIPMYKAARDFEESLISHTPSEKLYSELQKICIKINKMIVEKFYIDNSEEVVIQEGTSVELNELLDTLRNSLQTFDPESCDQIITKLKSRKWQGIGQGIDETELLKLCTEVENYRFENALEFLDRLGAIKLM